MSLVRGMNYSSAGVQPNQGERFGVSDKVFAKVNEMYGGDQRNIYCASEAEIKQNRRASTVQLKGALTAMAIVVLILSFWIVPNMIRTANLQHTILETSKALEVLTEKNQELSKQVLDTRDSLDISYKAGQSLEMRPAEAAQTYYITAPETRPTVTTTPEYWGLRAATK